LILNDIDEERYDLFGRQDKICEDVRSEFMLHYPVANTCYQIDIPFSVGTQAEAIRIAGFKNVEVIFSTINSNIVVAKKQQLS